MKKWWRKRLWAGLFAAILLTASVGCAESATNGTPPSSPASVAPSSPLSQPETKDATDTEASAGPADASASASSSPQAADASSKASAAPSEEPSNGSKPSDEAASSSKPSPNAGDKKPRGAKPVESPSPSPSAETANAATLTIVGNKEWGIVLAPEEVSLKKGDTAASVLKRAGKAHRLVVDARGSGSLTYIEGIDGLYEFDDGPLSGWKYRVNGVVMGVGAGAYEMKPGDRVEWYYVSEDEEAKEEKEKAP
ncbi:DUF4430 domain-containing protein [Cohnella faecalis]|uniref:DUF4430 domain-containing protein n=1 Tax=Cohnella faecalis TaxID=2315694 RepID=A0A398CK59_9BACL|nr:DUF4430 domain-containing protein [Cohnella faecalis]RIE01258.1 DUF4430 domain-containing protein [Cohnella faecalis]